MDEVSAKPSGRNWAKIAWITLAGFLVIFTGTAVFLSGADPTPTVYHRVDGTFSLNRPDGPSTTPEALRDLLKTYEKFGRVRFVCNPQTKFSDWNPYLNCAGESGAGSFALESGQNQFVFTLPLLDNYSYGTFDPDSIIINLSDTNEPVLDNAPGSDVIIYVNPDGTCDEALEAAKGFKDQPKSITIISDSNPVVQALSGYVFLHHRKDRAHANHTFRLKRSKSWNDHIQPVIDQIKAIF